MICNTVVIIVDSRTLFLRFNPFTTGDTLKYRMLVLIMEVKVVQ